MLTFFLSQLVKILPNFLEKPVDQWANDGSHKKIGNIIKGLKVVNDAGEQAVRLGANSAKRWSRTKASAKPFTRVVEL